MTGQSIGPIAAIRVFVHDVDAAKAFYNGKLGLVLDHATLEYLLFDAGGVQLIIEPIAQNDVEHAGYVGRFTGISFAVADCRAAHTQLSKLGVPFDGPPEKQDWGGILAHFTDPDGNILTLVENP